MAFMKLRGVKIAVTEGQVRGAIEMWRDGVLGIAREYEMEIGRRETEDLLKQLNARKMQMLRRRWLQMEAERLGII